MHVKDFGSIHGHTTAQFTPVKQAFANLWQDIEVGASMCVFHKGRKVIDLWGGYLHPVSESRAPELWQADTLVNVYSATKGMATLAFAILVGEGKANYEDKVSQYWPEFGAAGKKDITIAQLLSHQAGLCGVEKTLSVADLYDWDKMTRLLAEQTPLWKPGVGSGYHAVTWGYFPGELVKRITGKTLGQYFDEKVRQPLRADFFIGLPDSEFNRCASLIGPNRARKKPAVARKTTTTDLYPIALLNPPISPYKDACSPAWRRAELAASNGHASARGMATIYAAMSMQGQLNGTVIVSPQALEAATQIEVRNDIDKVTGAVVRRSRGFILNTDGCYGPNPDAFGHAGAGGSMAYADPHEQLSFAYAMNQMQADPRAIPRSKILTDAVFSCL